MQQRAAREPGHAIDGDRTALRCAATSRAMLARCAAQRCCNRAFPFRSSLTRSLIDRRQLLLKRLARSFLSSASVASSNGGLLRTFARSMSPATTAIRKNTLVTAIEAASDAYPSTRR